MLFNKKIFVYTCAFVLLAILPLNPTSALKTMYIEITPSVVLSNEYFSISVFDPTINNVTPYLTDVFIDFNENTYNITSENDNGEITIEAPSVLMNTSYTLTAYKEGYDASKTTLIVIASKPEPSYKLCITPETSSIQAYEPFIIFITNSSRVPVENVTVNIQESAPGQSFLTNRDGQVTLTAPNQDKITIIAKKQGYIQAEMSLTVITQPDVIDTLLQLPNFPIAIAVVILITVIIYVSQKNRLHAKRSIAFSQEMAKNHISQIPQFKDTKTVDEHSNIKDTVASQSSERKDSKIEEIHIPSTRSAQDVITIQKPTTKPLPSSPQLHRWFEQPIDLHSKIDNLLDTASKKNTEKWFIGTEDVRKKIDETLKENNIKVIKKYQIKQ